MSHLLTLKWYKNGVWSIKTSWDMASKLKERLIKAQELRDKQIT